MTFKVKKKSNFPFEGKASKDFYMSGCFTVKGKKNHQQYMRLH